jgi:hypothetical protein
MKANYVIVRRSEFGSQVYCETLALDYVIEAVGPRQALVVFLFSWNVGRVISIYECQASENTQKELVCWFEL